MSLKMLYGTSVKPLPHSVEISRVGNLIMVEWSLKYGASKSILCSISRNTKITSSGKNLNENFKLHVCKFCGIFFVVEKCIS